ncbi:MAG TPA: polysaccharide lyase family protein, partial [Thermomicrobiales bacterium]|nr:polysaccharide lyase family protein [Thermomicrobiales bacterium]
MTDEILWAIGAPDGRSPDLVDTYKTPNLLGDVVWTVPPAGQTAPPRRWPLFHPSEADPDAGYRPHPYTVVFPLDHEPAGAYLLRLDYLAIAPRLAYLELQVNGVSGLAYLRPAPSRSGEIRLQAGLHTTIYAEGVAEVVVPAALLRRGENRLVLTARDGGSVLAVENPAAIERLDRMADAAGFVYQWLTFARLAKPPRSVLAATEVAPSVVYVTGADGALVERCSLYLELARGIGPSVLALEIDDTGRRERTAFAVPAAAFGHLRLPFDLPDGPSPAVAYTLAGTLGGEAARREGTLTRRRKWTVYVAPHA